LKDRMCKAIIRIAFNNDLSKLIYKAISPEVRDRISKRIEVNARDEDKSLIIEVQAEDITSLRAAVNSYLRILAALIRTLGELHAERYKVKC